MISVSKISVCSILLLCGCQLQNQQDETVIKPHSDVTVVSPVVKDAAIIKEFQGITRYIQRIEIRAHVTGIISKVNVTLAERISPGKMLFEIKPRETSLLESTRLASDFIRSAADTVFAFSTGIVNQINVQQGDFVQEGDLLASCLDRQSLRIIVSVPLETDVAEIDDKPCTIIFPDGKLMTGIIGSSLPVANETDQTSEFLIKPDIYYPVPENIRVKVRVKTGILQNGIFLPSEAVYGNEEQSRFWIYKISNDSMVIRVSVVKGITADSMLQILGTGIGLNDMYVLDGGYGLPDSALINIISSGK